MVRGRPSRSRKGRAPGSWVPVCDCRGHLVDFGVLHGARRYGCSLHGPSDICQGSPRWGLGQPMYRGPELTASTGGTDGRKSGGLRGHGITGQ